MYKIEDNIYAEKTDLYGMSLFAKRSFKKDELVFVAYGPIVKIPTLYTIPISASLKIDPTRPDGNFSQYICHSCNPNLGIKERTCFVAFKDIEVGEEITIDYAMIGYDYGEELLDGGRTCSCGHPECRGKWGCYKELPMDIREKYKGYISDYLLEMD